MLMNGQIDAIIKLHAGWKADILSDLRETILSADPHIIEEVKWKMATRPEGLPVWSLNGIVCFAEIWKDNVKLLFPHGAMLKAGQKLFNARLKSSEIRAIEFKEGQSVDASGLTALVKEAVQLNTK